MTPVSFKLISVSNQNLWPLEKCAHLSQFGGRFGFFPPGGEGGTPKTPLHIITFTPLGVRNFQQKFQETHAATLVCFRMVLSLKLVTYNCFSLQIQLTS